MWVMARHLSSVSLSGRGTREDPQGYIDNRGAHHIKGGGHTPPSLPREDMAPGCQGRIQGDTLRNRTKDVSESRSGDQQNRGGSVGFRRM